MLISQAPSMQPARLRGSKSPVASHDSFSETYQGKKVVYGYNQDGQLEVQGGSGKTPGSRTLLDRSLALGKRVVFPPNMETSVSKDYLATRSWHCLHQLVQGIGGFAIGAAALAALANDPTWGAAVKGGAAMASFGLIRGYVCNGTGFLTSFQVEKAEKNPRAWMIAGEALANLGGVVGALGSVPSVTSHVPGGLLSLTLAAAAISTVAGVMKGAATANVNQRQAIDGNLAQVNIANSHQDMFVGFAAGAGGAALMAALSHYSAGAMAMPVVAGVTGVLGTLAMTQWVKHLDYHPVTEEGLRGVVKGLDEQGKVVGPKPDKLMDMMSSLGQDGSITLGSDNRPATRERNAELKGLYQGRNYILDMKDGKPYVMLRENCTAEDRCQAVLQAIHLENLQASDEFSRLAKEKGQSQAEHWLVQASLQRTPSDIKPFLQEMEAAGWSIDIMKFSDTGRRIS